MCAKCVKNKSYLVGTLRVNCSPFLLLLVVLVGIERDNDTLELVRDWRKSEFSKPCVFPRCDAIGFDVAYLLG